MLQIKEFDLRKESESDYLKTMQAEFLSIRAELLNDPKLIGFRQFDIDYGLGSFLYILQSAGHIVGGASMSLVCKGEAKMLPCELEFRSEAVKLKLSNIVSDINLENYNYAEITKLFLLPRYRNGYVLEKCVGTLIGFMKAKDIKVVFFLADILRTRKYSEILMKYGVGVKSLWHLKLPKKECFEGVRMILSYFDLQGKF